MTAVDQPVVEMKQRFNNRLMTELVAQRDEALRELQIALAKVSILEAICADRDIDKMAVAVEPKRKSRKASHA